MKPGLSGDWQFSLLVNWRAWVNPSLSLPTYVVQSEHYSFSNGSSFQDARDGRVISGLSTRLEAYELSIIDVTTRSTIQSLQSGSRSGCERKRYNQLGFRPLGIELISVVSTV